MGHIFGQINYSAVLVAGIAFWFVGMVWFSWIVGKSWMHEMKKHGIALKKPTSQEMAVKSIGTFVLNFIVCFAIAFLVYAIGIHTWGAGLLLGVILGIFIAALPMITAYVWENRSVKLSLMDITYPIVGIIVATLIITLWR